MDRFEGKRLSTGELLDRCLYDSLLLKPTILRAVASTALLRSEGTGKLRDKPLVIPVVVECSFCTIGVPVTALRRAPPILSLDLNRPVGSPKLPPWWWWISIPRLLDIDVGDKVVVVDSRWDGSTGVGSFGSVVLNICGWRRISTVWEEDTMDGSSGSIVGTDGSSIVTFTNSVSKVSFGVWVDSGNGSKVVVMKKSVVSSVVDTIVAGSSTGIIRALEMAARRQIYTKRRPTTRLLIVIL